MKLRRVIFVFLVTTIFLIGVGIDTPSYADIKVLTYNVNNVYGGDYGTNQVLYVNVGDVVKVYGAYGNGGYAPTGYGMLFNGSWVSVTGEVAPNPNYYWWYYQFTASSGFNGSTFQPYDSYSYYPSLTVYVGQMSQSISFNSLPQKTYGDSSFSLSASATSGLAVSFSSSNSNIASINGNTVTILAPGTVTITASQGGNGSYYAASNVQQTLVINPKSLTVTGTTVIGKEYNGNTSISLSGSQLNGVLSGDTLTLSNATTGTLNNANVGSNKAVTTAMALDGAKKAYYILVQPTGLTGTVTPKTLTIAGNFTANDKIYDGTSEAQLNENQLGLSGLLDGDTVQLSPELTFDNANTGQNKTISIDAGSSISNSNYQLSLTGAPTGSASILARPLALSGFTAGDKVYDGTTAVLSGTGFSDNRLNGDQLSYTYSTNFADIHAGQSVSVLYSGISLSGGQDQANYSLSTTTGSAMADITQRDLMIRAAAKEKIYGESDPTLTYTDVGSNLVDGDALAGVLVREVGEAVGTYQIKQGTLAASSDYSMSFEENEFSIAKRPITIKADVQEKEYSNSDPTFSYTIESGNLVFTDAFGGSLTRDTGENVGNYSINQGTLSVNGNYAIAFNGTVFRIYQKTLSVPITIQRKPYDGTTLAAISSFGDLIGVKSGDQVQLVTTGAFAYFETPDTGESKSVYVEGLTLSGINADQYTIGNQQVSGTIEGTVKSPWPKVINGVMSYNIIPDVSLEGNQSVSAVEIKEEKFLSLLSNQASGITVAIKIPTTDPDKVVITIPNSVAQKMADQDTILEIKSELAHYKLPFGEINFRNLEDQLETHWEGSGYVIRVEITRANKEELSQWEKVTQDKGDELLTPPMHYQMSCITGNTQFDISEFSGYVEKLIEIRKRQIDHHLCQRLKKLYNHNKPELKKQANLFNPEME